MRTKRTHEGYLLIDHRAGDGFSDDVMADAVAVKGGTLFESSTITCSHCQKIVIINPDRSRSRGYCPGCDHYICDECELVRVTTLTCTPFKKIRDAAQEAGYRNLNIEQWNPNLPLDRFFS
jgi:hypothetical protein